MLTPTEAKKVLSTIMNSTNSTTEVEPFALKIVLRLVYALVFVVGLFGNLLVCIVVVQQRRMRTVINYFTLNLAMSDLIFIIVYLPSQLAAYENNQNWPFGNIGCRFVYSILPVCLSASITTLLVISFERFRGIVFPFQPRLHVAIARWIILLIWLISFGTTTPLMIVAGIQRVKDNVYCDELWPSEESSRYYWITMFLIQYVIPLFVMIVLYGIAGWKIQRHSTINTSKVKRQTSINSVAQDLRQRQSQKITKMLVALVLLYSFCMLPQHVIYFWRTYGAFTKWRYNMYVFRISNLFPMANSALNPIVYGTLQTDFKEAYKKLFKSCMLGSCTKSNDSVSMERTQVQGNVTITIDDRFRSVYEIRAGENHMKRFGRPEANGRHNENAFNHESDITDQNHNYSIDFAMDDILLLRDAKETRL